MPGQDEELERLICEVREARRRLQETLGHSQRLLLPFEALQARCERARRQAAALVAAGKSRSPRSVH
jgi:hypothetical protein